MRWLLPFFILAVFITPTLASDDDDCDHDEITTYSPRHKRESWGDYYQRNQEQVERQYRDPRRDRR
jgi:hypothetical protein